MIAGLHLDLLTQAPALFVMWTLAVVISIVVHELAHGVVAIWQGDDTPRVTGHMTWNPMVHMGGFSLLLLVVVGIAYGQMPVNPSRFRSRFGQALVAAAGPVSNLLLALLGLTVLGVWMRIAGVSDYRLLGHPGVFFFLFGFLNLVLCIFNMLPIPPLDGSTVLADVSPGFRRLARDPKNEPFFMGAFLLVFFFFSADLWPFAEGIAKQYLQLLHG